MLLLLKEGRGASSDTQTQRIYVHIYTHARTHIPQITPNHTFWGSALKSQIVYLKVFNLNEFNAFVQFVLFHWQENTSVSEEKPGAHCFSFPPAAINVRLGTALNSLNSCMSVIPALQTQKPWMSWSFLIYIASSAPIGSHSKSVSNK